MNAYKHHVQVQVQCTCCLQLHLLHLTHLMHLFEYRAQVLATAWVAPALSAHTLRVQLSMYWVSARRRQELGLDTPGRYPASAGKPLTITILIIIVYYDYYLLVISSS